MQMVTRMVEESMIELSVNKYIWDKLSSDSTFNARYDKYRTQFGANFMPFFPVVDNNAGDISWGTEPYFLYDSMSVPPREVFGEKHIQMTYTLVATLPELFTIKQNVVDLFDHWLETTFSDDVSYRINDMNIWQPDRARGRDKVRQTYSTTLLLDVYYFDY